MIEQPMAVLAVLLTVLAGLFLFASLPVGARFFRVVPLLVFAYFIPTALSNVGLLPLQSPLYAMIQTWLLPASLILLTMSVDIPALLKLGSRILILFLAATATIVVGGPLAYLCLGQFVPVEMGEEAWKGLAALSGSWIGGGANFIAIGKSVGVADSTLAMIVVVDVALANIWMAILLVLAGHEKELDARLGADRRGIETLKAKIESFQNEVTRPTCLKDLLLLLAIAIGGTVIAVELASQLPASEILSPFAWTVCLVTAMGVGLSLTPARRLEGAGASTIGGLFLYLLVASIGAKAEFARVLDAPALLLIGAVWITFHAIVLLALRYFLKAPLFSMAVASQANIGGAASAPIVASAFHPALAPVGAIMGVAGYILGTYAGLLCAALLRWAWWVVGSGT
jgi:uncharacterized membrane protein